MTRCGLLVAGLLALTSAAAAQQQQKIGAPPEALNMRLVGSSDLQACSAYIYIVGRANTGLHILELEGAARQVAGLK